MCIHIPMYIYYSEYPVFVIKSYHRTPLIDFFHHIDVLYITISTENIDTD